MRRGRVRLVLAGPSGTEKIAVIGTPRGWIVERGGTATTIDAVWLPDGRLSLLLEDGRQICGRVIASDGAAVVESARGTVRVKIEDPLHHTRRAASAGADEAGEEVRALMPGRVIEVAVAEGQTVEAGAILLILEAMKMQNEIRASIAGRVARLLVSVGQAVEQGTLMVSVEAPACDSNF